MCLLNSHERSPFVLPVAAEQWSCLCDGISLPGQSPDQEAGATEETSAWMAGGLADDDRLNYSLRVQRVQTGRVILMET